MTDNKIIKALECCVKTEFISDCAKCEMFAFDCKDILIENALDLINRQKEEIGRLKKRNTLLLKKKCKDINTARKIIKSEAIKEFAKFIIDKSKNRIIRAMDIPDYVKEMTEELNGKS